MPPGKSAGEPQWPPRSPHEALLSTPGGREKLRRMIDRTSPSPSPSKKRNMNHNSAAIMMDGGDDDEDEDEETLQLKLAAIQAQLKLKKLQKDKARRELDDDSSSRPGSSMVSDASITTGLNPSRQSARPPLSPTRIESVQVPASPVRKVQQQLDPTSPSRIRLGIDKGLTARDISLKRAPSLKRPQSQMNLGERQSEQFQRTGRTGSISSLSQRPEPQPMTFGQRMAAARSDEASRLDRQARLKEVRSTAFGIGRNELEDLKKNAADLPELPEVPTQFSREDIMSTTSRAKKPAADAADTPAIEPYSGFHLSRRIIPHAMMGRTMNGKEIYNIENVLKHVKAPDFELPDVEKDIVILAIVASKSDPKSHKSTSTLKEKAGKDENPAKYMVLKLVDLQWELDLFLFNTGFERYWKLQPGTVVAILNPTIMPPPPGRTDTGKFGLVINSGEDTILEVGLARDLGFCKSIRKDGKVCDGWVNKKRTEFCEFHMNAALDKSLKKRQDLNAFNTGSGGPGRGGGGGGAWGDKKKFGAARGKGVRDMDEEYGMKKGKGRFDRETQSAWFLHKKDSAAAMLDNEFLSRGVSGTIERGEALKRRLATQEKERDIMKQLGSVGGGMGKEYMRLAREKRDAAAASSSSDTGGGGGCFTEHETSSGSGMPVRHDAKSLGLLKDKDHKIHLSPVKRKRAESAMSGSFASTAASTRGASYSSRTTVSAMGNNSSSGGGGSGVGKTEALGWGGGLKSKLGRMKDGENLKPRAGSTLEHYGIGRNTPSAAAVATGSASGGDGTSGKDLPPARKKTRFVTERGIKIAGRESLGDELGPRMVMLDDDDDEDLVLLDE